MEKTRGIFEKFPKNANSKDLLELVRDRLILEFASKNNFDFVLKGVNG